jgi:hypothetical protein
VTWIQVEDRARPAGSDSQPVDARVRSKTSFAALGASFRTGVANYVADSSLDEGGIRALAEAADLFEGGP